MRNPPTPTLLPRRAVTILATALSAVFLSLSIPTLAGASPTPPAAPTSPAAVAANASADVTWGAGAAGSAAIVSYKATATDQTNAPNGGETCTANLVANTDVNVQTTPSASVLSPDGTTLYVANYGSGTVSVIDTATNAVTATIHVGNGPNALAISSDGTTLYVANATDATVSVINTNTNTVTGSITSNATSGTLALSPNGATLYETNSASDTLIVMSTTTDTVTGSVLVGNGPWGTTLSSSGATLYVDNATDATISVINTSSNTVTSTISVPNGANFSALNSAGTTLYVANSSSSGYLSTVSTTTDTVTSSTAIAGTPTGIIDTASYIYLTVAGSPSGVYVYADGSGGLVSVLAASSDPVAPSASTSTLYVANSLEGSTSSYVASTGFVPATTCELTGLTNGDTYVVTVTATNVYGTGPASVSSSTFTPAAVPGAPTGVYASSNLNAQALVNWTAPSSTGGSPITTYTLKYSTSPYSTWTTATTSATGTQYLVTGLANGTAYEFEAAATNATGTGPLSAASLPATPATVPTAPGAPTGTAGNAQVTLSWTTPSSTGGSPITSYTVTATPGAETCNTTTATTCTVTGLTNGTAYTFTVTATNVEGVGVSSAPSAAVTPANGPGAPSAVVATPGADGSVVVTWVAPVNDNGSPVTGYNVSVTPGTGTCTTTTALTCTVTGLAGATAYSVSVTAINANGTSAPATATFTTTATTTTTTLPATPTPIVVNLNLFVNKRPGTTATGRSLLKALAARIAKDGDTKVTLYSYVTGLATTSKDRALATARATVASVNLRYDLRLLHSAAVVTTKASVGTTRTHIVAN